MMPGLASVPFGTPTYSSADSHLDPILESFVQERFKQIEKAGQEKSDLLKVHHTSVRVTALTPTRRLSTNMPVCLISYKTKVTQPPQNLNW